MSKSPSLRQTTGKYICRFAGRRMMPPAGGTAKLYGVTQEGRKLLATTPSPSQKSLPRRKKKSSRRQRRY